MSPPTWSPTGDALADSRAVLPAPATDSSPAKSARVVAPFLVLVGIVVASATQTEAASYLASKLEYDKPYFSFYITHCSFALVFPIHLALLALFSGGPRGSAARARTLLRHLRAVLADQLGCAPRWRVLARPLAPKIVPLTCLISAPALCWYVAMAFSPAMDITAIYATSAFHAYFFSLLLLGTKLTRTTVIAIAVAFLGVCVLTLDGASAAEMGGGRVFGDLVMVAGAIGLGLYEVVYKMVLPESQGGAHVNHAPGTPTPHTPTTRGPHQVPTPSQSDDGGPDDSDADDDRFPLDTAPAEYTPERGSRTPLLAKAKGVSANSSRSNSPAGHIRNSSSASYAIPQTPPRPHFVHQQHALPTLPTAFLSNFLTSLIGVTTLVLFCIPIPILHWTGIETYQQPSGATMWGTLVVICAGGSIYNAGLMTLIALWGPTTSSVANLLTIGLVAVADAVWMGNVPSLQTLFGAVLICGGFAALLAEGEHG